MVKRCFGVSWDLEASLFLERMERARFLCWLIEAGSMHQQSKVTYMVADCVLSYAGDVAGRFDEAARPLRSLWLTLSGVLTKVWISADKRTAAREKIAWCF